MNKDKNIFTVNNKILYKNKEYIISRFETLDNILLVGLVNLTHLVNLKDIEHISNEYKILETRISNNLQQVIWKIKRLSDGEIFTVGDNVIPSTDLLKCTTADYFKDKITSFEIYKDILKVNGKKFYVNLNSIKHYKKPLFTTEDGVDIFDNDEAYYLHRGYFTICKAHSPTGHDNYVWFSTREKAEEYILMNKPCLSINNVINLLEFEYNQNLNSNITRIKNNLIGFIRYKL